MNYNRPMKDNSTITIRVMCAIVFVCFSLLWLYCFQVDLLAMAQHLLSGGLTQYNRVLSPLLLTALLCIVQLGVYGLVRLTKSFHALTYLPSMLILALLSDIYIEPGTTELMHHGWWIVVVTFIVWLLGIVPVLKYQDIEDYDDNGLFSRPIWINMLIMSLQICFVTWIGNTNAVFHYRMQAESLLIEGHYDKAAKVGKKSLEGDESLLAIRMYALARTGSLGEHLFEFPITGTSKQMLPTNDSSLLLLYPRDSLFRFFSARPAEKMLPERYLRMIERRNAAPRKAVGDYLLCGYLIDKKLDEFASEISKYYNLDNQLPKHYREALTLYCHLRSKPILSYSVPVVEEDFRNLQELERQYPDPQERKVKVSEQYRGTYWYYYRYE